MASGLEQRIDKLVLRLRVLSEAETGSIAQFTSHGKADSQAPKGAKPDSRHPHPDHDPLIVWFLHELDRKSDDELGRRILVARAEMMLERRVKKQPGRIAGAMFEGAPETAKERDQRILREYLDVDEHEAAALESERAGYCSPASIRLTRIRNDCDSHTGRPVHVNERQHARQLREAGMTLGQIALKLGKPKSTIQGWTDDKKREAA